jgi:hypothetical protein
VTSWRETFLNRPEDRDRSTTRPGDDNVKRVHLKRAETA